MRRVLIAGLVLAACSPAPSRETEACVAPAREQAIATVYFGRKTGSELGVSDEEWQSFVDAEITPRFPSGFTVTDAQGQWNSNEGVVHEPSKVLTVFLDEEERGRALLDDIADVYKHQFEQEAVALVIERSCVSFE